MIFAMARVAPEKPAFRPGLPSRSEAGLQPEKTSMANEVPQNVFEFLNRASDRYGRFHADTFSQWMFSECYSYIQSPIEQLFLIAINLVAEINFVPIGIVGTVVKGSFNDDSDTLQVVPQWSVGKYRADFALRRHPIDKIVCVELDGHDFHDRDERQRRYEKSRDRFFTAQGYSVLHFTGSEVVKDPCAVAIEAFRLATDFGEDVQHPFDPD